MIKKNILQNLLFLLLFILLYYNTIWKMFVLRTNGMTFCNNIIFY